MLFLFAPSPCSHHTPHVPLPLPVAPRSLVMHLLSRAEQVNQSGTGKVKLTCQFLELYNDNIR